MSIFTFIDASWRFPREAGFVPRYRSIASKRQKVPELRRMNNMRTLPALLPLAAL
jgi:hypothetical protein